MVINLQIDVKYFRINYLYGVFYFICKQVVKNIKEFCFCYGLQ